MTHDEMIQVIQAHKEGKQLQYRGKHSHWADIIDPPAWAFHAYDYRVKPEPRVVWINEYPRTVLGDTRLSTTAHPSKESAAFDASSSVIATRKFIEVLED